MYEEPCESQPCMNCEFRAYDSFHNEMYCTHKPLAEGVGYRSLIDKWGTCEYWKEWII